MIVKLVEKELEGRKDDPQFAEHVAAMIVTAEAEMLRARREIKAGRSKMVAYPKVISIVIDELRRGLRSHNGEAFPALSVFLGLRTNEEEEARQSAQLSTVVSRENRVVITEIKTAIEDAIPKIANLTVSTLRSTKAA